MKLSSEADISALQYAETLPEDLMSAIEVAKTSEFVSRYIPAKTLEKFFEYKSAEYRNYSLSKVKDEFVTKLYFSKI